MKTALFSPLLRFFLCHRLRRREKLCMIEKNSPCEVCKNEDHGH